MSSESNDEIEEKRIRIDVSEESDKSFSNLPTEVVERIFENLPAAELITSSAVCRKWCEISQLPKFRENIMLKIQQSKIDKKHHLERVIQKSKRKFSNLYFGDQMPYCHRLAKNAFFKMANIFADIEYFKLENVVLTYDELCLILARMKNLKHLSIVGCNFHLDETNRIEDELIEPVKSVLNNLVSFEFQATVGTYEKLSQLTEELKKLQKLRPGFRKSSKLYSDAITETNLLCSIIESNKETLRELHIPTYQNKLPLSSVYQIQNLNLDYLSVDYDYYSPPVTLSLDTFLQAHKNVTTLIVSVKSYKKLDLELIATNMLNLERLEVSADRKNIHNLSLLTISKFKKLKIFKALKSPSPSFSRPELASNLMLKELQIQNMDLSETDIINISEKLPNLEKLALQSIALTNGGLQAIIKNLSKLKYLNLENTSSGDSKVTEYGISGFDNDLKEQTGVSIENLQKLQYLQLWGIKTISDNCLINNFRFANITKIFISNSDGQCRVTLPILNYIFRNCPKLEEFVLTN